VQLILSEIDFENQPIEGFNSLIGAINIKKSLAEIAKMSEFQFLKWCD